MILSVFFIALLIPLERIANREVSRNQEVRGKRRSLMYNQAELVGLPETVDSPKTCNSNNDLQYPRSPQSGISAREQLRRRGSF